MTRQYWLELGPSLLVGTGIILSTFVATLAAGSGWLVLAGPLLLVLAVVGADVLDSRLKGKSSGPSPAALILGTTFLLAGAILVRDPNHVRTLIPIVGIAAWVVLLRPESRRNTCGGI
jgi:hypothetical protein